MFTDQLPLGPTRVDRNTLFEKASAYDVDFSDVRGQEAVTQATVESIPFESCCCRGEAAVGLTPSG